MRNQAIDVPLAGQCVARSPRDGSVSSVGGESRVNKHVMTDYPAANPGAGGVSESEVHHDD